MKRLFLLSFFVFLNQSIYSQKSELRNELDLMNNEINLNAYKYIVIEDLSGDSQKWGVDGFSEFIEKTLEKKKRGKRKYNVVSLSEAKPDDLINNPALGLYVFGTYGDRISSGITLDSNLRFGSMIGTNDNSKVYLEFYDHNDNLLRVVKSNATNFHSSVIDALSFMTEFNYKFNPQLVVYDSSASNNNLDGNGNNLLDIKSEKSVREYFDKNGTDLIEGIWEHIGSTYNYKIAIILDDYIYRGTVLESSNREFKPGSEKVTFETSASDKILTIKWFNSVNSTNPNKSVAKNDDNLLITFRLPGTSSEWSFYRTYPKKNSSGEKKARLKTGEWIGNGSGIIISESGYIITNNHVIEDADEIEVEFLLNNEIQEFNAEIVQVDKVNDLAIIKIFDMNFDGVDDLPYNFKSRSSDVGTTVYAYGYPMALTAMGKEIKVTDGIINSKSGFDGDITTYQISAPIQKGNSGGPLFDDKGNFIGINSAVIRKDIADNVGYTIKSSYVLNLLDVLPKTIDLPSSTKLKSLPLTEQIKEISKYVVLIKIK